MKIWMMIVLLLLQSGCRDEHQPLENPAAHKVAESSKIAAYNRYILKGDRYTQAKDGTPANAEKIDFKNPIPKNEPLSRYGNPVQYHVDGKKYKVLPNAAGYKTRGIASWYGTKFQHQRTSSGEPYNMYSMSAAHKTLPLPTYVKVKNLNNGKEAIVKVNDRGPFHSDRIIDLSYAAALKIGVYPKGTAPVEIETLSTSLNKTHYFLQAGAFSSESFALQLKEKLKAITTSPVLIEHYKQHYIVRVGPFGDKQMADSLKTILSHKGIRGAFSLLI